jgi:uncharacterized protein (TIGR02594 family)
LSRKFLIAVSALALIAFTATAVDAKPRHKLHHRHHVVHLTDSTPSFFGSSSLVNEAKRHMGTNPTGRGRAWCGAFMDLILKKTGHAGGGNLARGYARYGTRISGPKVGAIAVMNHHVGVVSGLDANGNPILVSGNHNRTVAESVYPRSRIIAYVMPNG